MLKIENLHKSFGRHEVIQGLNLTVEDGSVFGLVGINGAGKSTLLRLISGVYEPEGGSVLLDDQNTYTVPQSRSRISYVSDETYYPLGATIGSVKQLYETMYMFDKEAYEKYAEIFELNDRMTVSSLSKGMKRRAALLMALSTHPSLLLLDEAYDGLEPLARFKFRQILSEMVSDSGMSVIIASHNLRELEDICDTYGILDEGIIKSTGDLAAARVNVNRYQTAFATEVTREDFSQFDVIRYEQEGRVVRLVIRGPQEEVSEKLQAMHPVLLDVLPASFEELFMYEVESRG